MALSNRSALLMEPELTRMQREVELAITMLESQRKESSLLDEQIAIVQEEIIQRGVPNVRSSNALRKIERLERKLNFSHRGLSEARSSNQKIRQEIDQFRMKNRLNKQVIKDIQSEISLQTNKFKQVCLMKEDTSRKQNRNLEKIELVRSKTAEFQSRTNLRIHELNSKIKEGKLTPIAYNVESLACKPKTMPEIISNTNSVKGFIDLWKKRTQKKRAEFEFYKTKIRKLQGALDEISKATGIKYTDQIVTEFIKSEEQYTNIIKYLTQLNNDIDILEENSGNLISIIRKSKENEDSLHENIQKSVLKLKANHENIISKRNQCNERIDLFGKEFNSSFDPIQKILGLAKTTKFTLFNEDVHENNMILALQSVEDFSNHVLMLQAHFKSSNSALVAVPVELISAVDNSNKKKELVGNLDRLESFETDDAKVPLSSQNLRNRAREIYEGAWNRRRSRFNENQSKSPSRLRIF